ncbi:hypothetical protein EDB80DRAFT_218385 [Ilyonectria destructans]|nr:hypothetical protein EDB80DRAFT_218385 [Ilyonectria destructans]
MAGHRRDDEFSIPFHAFFISRQREEAAGVKPKQKWEEGLSWAIQDSRAWSRERRSLATNILQVSCLFFRLLLSDFVLVAACPRSRFSFLLSPFENLPEKNAAATGRCTLLIGRSLCFQERRIRLTAPNGFLFPVFNALGLFGSLCFICDYYRVMICGWAGWSGAFGFSRRFLSCLLG